MSVSFWYFVTMIFMLISLIFLIASIVMSMLFPFFQLLDIFNYLCISFIQMVTIYRGILCPCLENAWSGFTHAAHFIRVEFKAIYLIMLLLQTTSNSSQSGKFESYNLLAHFICIYFLSLLTAWFCSLWVPSGNDLALVLLVIFFISLTKVFKHLLHYFFHLMFPLYTSEYFNIVLCFTV